MACIHSLFCSWSQGENLEQGERGMAFCSRWWGLVEETLLSLRLTLTLGAGLPVEDVTMHLAAEWFAESFRYASSWGLGFIPAGRIMQRLLLVVEGSDRRLTEWLMAFSGLTVTLYVISRISCQPLSPCTQPLQLKGQDSHLSGEI